MKPKHMKVIGYLFTGLSILVSIGTNWFAEQKQEQLIAEKVAEAISKKQN